MNRKNIYNTKESGVFHFMIFKNREDFTAVCLDLDLVEYGKNFKSLQNSIQEAAISYLKAVKIKNLPDSYLNKPPKQEYLKKLDNINFTKKIECFETSAFVNQSYKGNNYCYA